MKKFRIFAAILVVIAMLAQIAPMSALAVGGDYTEREIHIYRDSMEEDETVTCRFYADFPEIPYIDFEVYLSVFNNDEVDIDGNADGAGPGEYYVICNRDGDLYPATINVNDDTIWFSDMSMFLHSPATDEEGEGEFYYIDMNLYDYEYVSYGGPAMVDLGAYGIDIIEDDGHLFFPVPTLSDLYSAVNQAVVYWNGEVFYYNSVIMDGGARDQDDECLSILVKNMNRSEALATYTYNEICFNIDNFFGFPCTQSPFMDRVQEIGLDATLEEYDPLCKQLLLAPESENHIAGMYRLFNFWLCDGGHTGAYMNDLIRTLYLDDDDYDRVVNAIRAYAYPDTDYENVYLDYNDSYMDNLYNIYFTRGYYFNYESFVVDGDTAVISFDGFEIDFDAWELYLKGEGPLPTTEDDTFGFVYDCLEKCKQNPEIKNVLFDISCNGGGYVAVYIAIMSLINVTAEYNVLDKYTGEKVFVDYIADRNLDGAIDENDLIPDYSMFNYGVLTSCCSFSCGNMLPSAMKDAGFMVIGEQSGGGTCPLDYNSTAEGLEYITSAGDSVLINANGESIDDGVPVFRNLVIYDDENDKTDPEGKDYSNFFNFDIIRQCFYDFYGAPAIPGDLDGDGSVTMKDLLKLRSAIAGIEELSDAAMEAADVNGDGVVNMKDVLALRKILASAE